MKNTKYYWVTSGILLVMLISGLMLTYHLFDFNLLQSDALGYWKDSLDLSTTFLAGHDHLPFFPLLIFILRGITGNYFAPVIYLQVITIISVICTAYLVFRLIRSNNQSFPHFIFGLLIAWIYILWPFEGLNSVVFPFADQLALLLYIAGTFFVLNEKQHLGFAFWGLGLITHKGLWPFIFFSVIVVFWDNWWRGNKGKKKHFSDWLWSIVLIILPIGLVSLVGFLTNGDVFWVFRKSVYVNITSNIQFPVFDGLISTFQGSALKILVKGGAISITLILGLFILWYLFRKGTSHKKMGIAISLAVIILILIMNQYTIWGAYRFGRLIILPMGWIIAENIGKINIKSIYFRSISIGLLIMFALSQFAFAWYIAKVFY